MVNKERVSELISRAVTNPNCPTCGKNTFSVCADIVALPVVREGRIIPTEGVSVVATVCNNCGHMSFFSAEKIGIDPVTGA